MVPGETAVVYALNLPYPFLLLFVFLFFFFFSGPKSVLEFDSSISVDVTFHFATWFDESDGATKYWVSEPWSWLNAVRPTVYF